MMSKRQFRILSQEEIGESEPIADSHAFLQEGCDGQQHAHRVVYIRLDETRYPVEVSSTVSIIGKCPNQDCRDKQSFGVFLF